MICLIIHNCQNSYFFSSSIFFFLVSSRDNLGKVVVVDMSGMVANFIMRCDSSRTAAFLCIGDVNQWVQVFFNRYLVILLYLNYQI